MPTLDWCSKYSRAGVWRLFGKKKGKKKGEKKGEKREKKRETYPNRDAADETQDGSVVRVKCTVAIFLLQEEQNVFKRCDDDGADYNDEIEDVP